MGAFDVSNSWDFVGVYRCFKWAQFQQCKWRNIPEKKRKQTIKYFTLGFAGCSYFKVPSALLHTHFLPEIFQRCFKIIWMLDFGFGFRKPIQGYTYNRAEICVCRVQTQETHIITTLNKWFSLWIAISIIFGDAVAVFFPGLRDIPNKFCVCVSYTIHSVYCTLYFGTENASTNLLYSSNCVNSNSSNQPQRIVVVVVVAVDAEV